MATPFQKYTSVDLFIKGGKQLEAETVDIDFSSGAKKNYTIAKGLAGATEGPRECSIKVSSAIPVLGLEFDFVKEIDAGNFNEFTIYAAGKTMTFSGHIDSGSLSFASQNESKASFTAWGNLAPFKSAL